MLSFRTIREDSLANISHIFRWNDRSLHIFSLRFEQAGASRAHHSRVYCYYIRSFGVLTVLRSWLFDHSLKMLRVWNEQGACSISNSKWPNATPRMTKRHPTPKDHDTPCNVELRNGSRQRKLFVNFFGYSEKSKAVAILALGLF